MRNVHLVVLWSLLCAGLLTLTGVSSCAEQKKLIEYGWDVPTPSYVAAHIREMEQRPFDGVVMRIPNLNIVFTNTAWDAAAAQADFDALPTIKWGRFTRNFIAMNVGSKQMNVDWFSDADWDAVCANAGLCARAAKLSHCTGLVFDPEPYGKNPWQYAVQDHAKEKSLEEYQAIVRRRGMQFMQAIQKQLPDPVIFTFFQLSGLEWAAQGQTTQVRNHRFAQVRYGLLPAFLDGMLDAASANATIIDGNERSYGFTEPQQFYQAYQFIHGDGAQAVAPENQRKYQAVIRCAQALHYDRYFNMLKTPGISAFMSADERMQWFESNLYYALRTTDEYVWLYSNNANWWTDENIQPGTLDAIARSVKKVEENAPLGFDFTPVARRAVADQAAKEKGAPSGDNGQ